VNPFERRTSQKTDEFTGGLKKKVAMNSEKGSGSVHWGKQKKKKTRAATRTINQTKRQK